jgi:hypothetical protein
MITLAKLKTYEFYQGDPDMYARSGKRHDEEPVADSEWYLIDSLIGDAAVILRHLGSQDRTADALRNLRANCESQDVIDRIMELAKRP